MCNDAYKDMTHGEMQQMLWRSVAVFADFAATEFKLPNGRIADVIYRVGKTRVIIEVKTFLKESLIYEAVCKYAQHCDYLVMATPPQLLQDDVTRPLSIAVSPLIECVGIWLVTWDGPTEARPARNLREPKRGPVLRPAPVPTPSAAIGSPACTADQPYLPDIVT